MSTELQPSTGPADTSSIELGAVEPTNRDLDHKREEQPVEKPLDRREAIAKAQAEIAAKQDEAQKKEEPKLAEKVEQPKVEAKTEVKPEDKPVQEQKTQPEKSDGVDRAAQEGDRPKPSEGKVSEAPARFLPKAQELWHQAPKVVRQEVERAFAEYEDAAKQYQAVSQEWESLKPYDQMAKSNGTSIKEALDRYTSIDKMLRTNPAQGLTEVFKIAGVDPRAFAQQILGQSQQQPQGQQNQPQRDPQVVSAVSHQQQAIQALNQKIAEMEQSQRLAEVNNSLIEPFKAEHPRYAELEGKMATLLQSGLVPTNMDAWQRLEAAYDMAERLSPRSMSASSELLAQPVETARRESPASGKSIKGAPTPGTDVGSKAGQKLDRKAAIQAAMAELGH